MKGEEAPLSLSRPLAPSHSLARLDASVLRSQHPSWRMPVLTMCTRRAVARLPTQSVFERRKPATRSLGPHFTGCPRTAASSQTRATASAVS